MLGERFSKIDEVSLGILLLGILLLRPLSISHALVPAVLFSSANLRGRFLQPFH